MRSGEPVRVCLYRVNTRTEPWVYALIEQYALINPDEAIASATGRALQLSHGSDHLWIVTNESRQAIRAFQDGRAIDPAGLSLELETIEKERLQATERQRRRREKLKTQGVRQYSVYAHPQDWIKIKALAKKLASKRAIKP